MSKVGTACGSATLCLAFGVCGVGLRPSLLEISITDVLGVSQEAQDETIEHE